MSRTKAEVESGIFAPSHEMQALRPFFLVGIGGAGMSALARLLKGRGLEVEGTDSTPSNETLLLQELGIEVRIGHSGEGITRRHQVVLSDAIDLDASPEYAAAKKVGCPVFRRSQLLGWLLKGKRVIAVTGSHGKTTTTGMVAAGLRAAGLDPLIIVGAEVPEFGASVIDGKGDLAVVEACEAFESYRDIDPHIVIVTNLEPDHLDYHEDFPQLLASVRRFAQKVKSGGAVLFCHEDAGACAVAEGIAEAVPYTLFDWTSRLEETSDEPVDAYGLAIPGRYAAFDAAAALSAIQRVTPELEKAIQAIREFRGAERRLQVRREGPITVVDDYAHHPTEIQASIEALRQRYPERRMVLVFQPHLFTRTRDQLHGFVEALDLADSVVLTDIYPAREDPIPGISSARIAEGLKVPVKYVPSRRLLPRVVAQLAQPGDLICGMGAGNISEFVPAFLEELDRTGPLRVAVVFGGDSTEREVSLHSGRAAIDALKKKGYDAYGVDASDLLLSRGDLSQFVGINRPDVAFLAVHGTHAEDGAIQGLFELLHIPYTGSTIQSSAIAMDKQLSKDVLAAHGIPTPAGGLLLSPDEPPPCPGPWVVKPNEQGSTVGLSFVERAEDLPEAVRRALEYGPEALVEQWIEGVEISVPVMGNQALPPVEIVPLSGRYDFAAKYTPGATDEIVPARLSEEVLERARELAVASDAALGCEGLTRTDMIVDGEDIYVLEINTLPGLTGTSLAPRSALAAGIAFEDLCDWLVQDALRRNAEKV